MNKNKLKEEFNNWEDAGFNPEDLCNNNFPLLKKFHDLMCTSDPEKLRLLIEFPEVWII